jgi:hypothetical protein
MVKKSTLSLRFDGGTLNLVPNDNNWTTVSLCRADANEQLGAEMAEYLTERLISFLEYPTDTLQWVLTLSETHNTVYGVATVGVIQMSIQNAQAVFFANIAISEQRCREWITQMKQWQAP